MSLKENPTPIDVIKAIKELEEATASGGTAVSVAGTPVSTLNFTSAPQDQIDALNEKTNDLVGKTYYVDDSAKGEMFNDYELNVASGICAHAEGSSTTATGPYSHAEGKKTFAYGGYSHSEGLETIANHTASHASGYFTKTGRNHQTVMGTRNVGKTNTLLEVGNGYLDDVTGNVINQNAFEVQEDGTLYTQNGTITDGTNSVSLGDVATKDEIPTNYITQTALLNLIYPVGSIYMSTEDISPASFLGGYWERLAEGRTLIGAGTSDKTFTAGEQNGASTHTLTTAQLPSHTHGLNSHTHSVPNHSHTFDKSTNNQYSANVISGYKSQARYPGWVEQNGGSSSWVSSSGYGTTWTGGGACTTGAASGNTAARGSGSAHNNLPPYLVVYMWKRIPDLVADIT